MPVFLVSIGTEIEKETNLFRVAENSSSTKPNFETSEDKFLYIYITHQQTPKRKAYCNNST